MSTLRPKDRASLCTFTFADGRRCRSPRQSGHPEFCFFHARKKAQAQAAEELGRDFDHFFSGDYFSACDVAAALSRLLPAVARGEVKPRTATTLAYVAQTLLQTIQLAQTEFTHAFGTQLWRDTVYSHVQRNYWQTHPRPLQPAPAPAAPFAPEPPLADALPSSALPSNEVRPAPENDGLQFAQRHERPGSDSSATSAALHPAEPSKEEGEGAPPSPFFVSVDSKRG